MNLPERRVGAKSAAALDERWAERHRIRTIVNRAMQRIRRDFEASRRPAVQLVGASRRSKFRHKKRFERVAPVIQLRLAALYRTPDVETMLPSDVIKGWQDDTSKITNPLLQGDGASG